MLEAYPLAIWHSNQSVLGVPVRSLSELGSINGITDLDLPVKVHEDARTIQGGMLEIMSDEI